jgi:hypothetical protein
VPKSVGPRDCQSPAVYTLGQMLKVNNRTIQGLAIDNGDDEVELAELE